MLMAKSKFTLILVFLTALLARTPRLHMRGGNAPIPQHHLRHHILIIKSKVRVSFGGLVAPRARKKKCSCQVKNKNLYQRTLVRR
jgi:hypothetical protein